MLVSCEFCVLPTGVDTCERLTGSSEASFYTRTRAIAMQALKQQTGERAHTSLRRSTRT